MKQYLLRTLPKLKSTCPSSDMFNTVWNQLNATDLLTKTDNPTHHFCAFFLPIYRPSQQIYLVHHKKANDWIAPGGHIEPNELPEDTVRREFTEELGHRLTDEPIKLFNLDFLDIKKPGLVCEIHYSIWYVVELSERIDFQWDPREFYDAKWIPVTEVTTHTLNKTYRNIMSNVFK
jgi:8-oxo-dGTP pyrophosphatase MutT (NUDIX family)